MTIRTRIKCCAALAVAVFVASGRPAFSHDGLAAQIAMLSAQIAQSPSSPSLFVKRAELYRQNRQWAEALADLDRAERIDPAIAIVSLVRAHVNVDRHHWPAAIDAATQFLAREPDHADARLVRARAYVQVGRQAAAAADFSRALAVRPNPDIYIERARAEAAAGGQGLPQAVRGLDEGIARLGPLVTLELEAIDLELRLQRYDAALARVERVAAQTPRKESWLARRGAILERAGRRDEARAAYTAALASLRALPERIQQARASQALAVDVQTGVDRLDGKATAVPDHPKRSR